ncbi:MAG TPA: redoxin domain-containing protein [bacterium]|nr:redoxin domain-containing protein [bacterium]
MRVRAVPFPDEGVWINTTHPLTLDGLRGHVVILDFWTYCCINCIHVLEDLKFLEDKFRDNPVMVIGVHSPKFDNEKEPDNVRAAVARYEIRHPVVLDNRHRLWQAYGIRAWPSFVVIDTEGRVMGRASGEGQRETLDRAVRIALREGRERGTLAREKAVIPPGTMPEAQLSFPGKLDIDPHTQRLFIGNSNRNQILVVRMESDTSGYILHTLGSGEAGFRDGPFAGSAFRKPQGIAYRDGVLYVADTENHAIRAADFETETVRTIAGDGGRRYLPHHEGDPLSVSLNSPWDLAVDEGNLYIAMAGNHQIWRLDLKRNVLSSLIGNGREDILDGSFEGAILAQPSGLALSGGSLYFADSEVSAVRSADLSQKRVVTLAGRGLFDFGEEDGPFRRARFQHPLGLDFNDGFLYVADTYNHAVRRMDLKRERMETLIGRTGKNRCTIDDSDCEVLPLFEPNDVVHYGGKLYIADTNNHLVRVFDIRKRILADFRIRETGP